MAEILIEGITKNFSGSKVLENLNLTFKSEEFVVVVGPSGCGKSTLLRMIAGLESITEGKIFIDGLELNEVPPQKRNIAMVFQNYALYPHMTVYENIELSLKIKKISKYERQQKIKNVALKLEILELLNRKPSDLSGGQKQRVAMARAMIRNPKLFLFDEPLSNLDTSLRGQMRHEIRKLHRQQKVTTLYVTHDQIEAMTLADKIIVLNGGVVQQEGTPFEVYNKPANTFVAEFFGTQGMNFFKASDLNEEFKNFLSKLKKQLIPSPKYDMTFGIRPEHFAVEMKGDSLRVQGFVEEIEMLGTTFLLQLRLDSGYTFRSLIPVMSNLSIGDKITLFFSIKNIHVFEGIPGKRINFDH